MQRDIKKQKESVSHKTADMLQTHEQTMDKLYKKQEYLRTYL